MSIREHVADVNNPKIASQFEVLAALTPLVEQNLTFLAPLDKSWQPADFLPDLAAPDWREQLERFRAPALEIADDALVVLVGDMVTEEALPSYAVQLNLIARDDRGDSPDAWARWLRGWTAEENRHGDLLNAYLRLTGRVDMRAIEITIQRLIAGGFNPRGYPDPYAGLIYTAFQERATKISHANLGKIIAAAGDEHLGRICAKIAGDESRHESFYTRMMGAVMERDPTRGLLVFREMMRRVIAMPGRLMHDGRDPDLFEHFATVAQRLNVYTVHDYASIIRHLVATWNIANLKVSDEAAAAQDFLCQQADRLETMAERISEDLATQPRVKFAWIFDREA